MNAIRHRHLITSEGDVLVVISPEKGETTNMDFYGNHSMGQFKSSYGVETYQIADLALDFITEDIVNKMIENSKKDKGSAYRFFNDFTEGQKMLIVKTGRENKEEREEETDKAVKALGVEPEKIQKLLETIPTESLLLMLSAMRDKTGGNTLEKFKKILNEEQYNSFVEIIGTSINKEFGRNFAKFMGLN